MKEVKPKEYVIEAYSNFYSSKKACFSFLAFRYDDDFFSDIKESLTHNHSSISFPVNYDFFDIFKFKSRDNVNPRIDKNHIKLHKFSSIDTPKNIKYNKVIHPNDFVRNIRLHVIQNTFHFEVNSIGGESFNTKDFDESFIDTLSSYHNKNKFLISFPII